MQGLKMTLAIAALILSYTTTAIPIPQGAGVGQGCDAIFTDADSGSGYAVQDGLENAASAVKSAGLRRRQGAGVGAGCNSIFNDADSGSGYGVQDALQNGASLVSSTTAHKRQANKIGTGAGAVLDLVPGAQGSSAEFVNEVDAVDDDGTNDSADIGQQVGDDELTDGTQLGELVSSTLGRRQANKIGTGLGAVLDLVPGAQGTSAEVVNEIDTFDTDGTNDSAQIGQQVGDDELALGTQAGELVPNTLGL